VTVFVDSNIPMYVAGRDDLFVAICPRVFDVTLTDTDRARDLLTQRRDLSARDAVHAALMLNRGIEWIATFDGGFDSVPGIRRYSLA
jgi:predicted nucleic acid-binding protein